MICFFLNTLNALNGKKKKGPLCTTESTCLCPSGLQRLTQPSILEGAGPESSGFIPNDEITSGFQPQPSTSWNPFTPRPLVHLCYQTLQTVRLSRTCCSRRQCRRGNKCLRHLWIYLGFGKKKHNRLSSANETWQPWKCQNQCHQATFRSLRRRVAANSKDIKPWETFGSRVVGFFNRIFSTIETGRTNGFWRRSTKVSPTTFQQQPKVKHHALLWNDCGTKHRCPIQWTPQKPFERNEPTTAGC